MSEDISSRSFRQASKGGYDTQDVHAFRDAVAKTVSELSAEVEQLRKRLASHVSTSALPRAEQMVDLIKSTSDGLGSAALLALAAKTADDHIARASSEAQAILAEAHARAKAAHEERERAHQRVIEQMEQRRVMLQDEINKLVALEQDYQQRVQTFLSDQLSFVQGRAIKAEHSRAAADVAAEVVEEAPAPVKVGANGKGDNGRSLKSILGE